MKPLSPELSNRRNCRFFRSNQAKVKGSRSPPDHVVIWDTVVQEKKGEKLFLFRFHYRTSARLNRWRPGFNGGVGQSCMMRFISPPRNKLSSAGDFMGCFFYFLLFLQINFMFSFLWINVFNVFASGLLLIDGGKREKTIIRTHYIRDRWLRQRLLMSFGSAVSFGGGDHWVLPTATGLIAAKR